MIICGQQGPTFRGNQISFGFGPTGKTETVTEAEPKDLCPPTLFQSFTFISSFSPESTFSLQQKGEI